jgi:very-short-patch-repair endonuclease
MILLIKMENQDFELVFISESDTDNVSDIKSNDDSDTDIASEIMSEKKELVSYSYISNGLYFEYFVGYEIASLLGYKNTRDVIIKNVSKCNRLEFRDYPGIKEPELDPRTVLITRDGAIEILIKTRKRISPDVLHLLKSFGIVTTNRKTLTKEQQTLSALTNAFKTEKFEDQFKVGRYYLDLYFPDYKIVVECDENGHADRKPYKERERMDYVNKELELTDDNWVRFNPDAEDFDISKVIGQIYTRINLFKSVQIQDLLERHESQPAPATELIPHRKCDKCGVVKVLNNDNFKNSGFGYTLSCIDCLREINTKSVFQYDMNGNYITKFPSIIEASKSTGLFTSQIGGLCNKKMNSVKGFVFRFASEHIEGEKIEPIKNNLVKKTVAKYDRDGKYIETYESATEAARQVNGSKEAIVNACKKSFLSHGFLWRYLEDRNNTEDIKGYVYVPNKKYMRHVEVYENDKLYKSFTSITEAAKEMKLNVSMCRKFLYGKKNDPKGYVWKFLEIKE